MWGAKAHLDSQAALDTVGRVRDAIHQVNGAEVIAGGDSATRGDTLNASSHDNKVIIPLILLVVVVILMALLRAVVAPLILIATVVLSFGVALGLSALIFRHVLGFAGADSSLPLFVFVFLAALGIDYNIFLMTRVHEEAKQFGTKRGAPHRARGHGRSDHLGRAGAGGYVRGARYAAGRVVRRDRVRSGAGSPARHADRAIGARHGAEPGHRSTHVVAQPTGEGSRSRGSAPPSYRCA